MTNAASGTRLGAIPCITRLVSTMTTSHRLTTLIVAALISLAGCRESGAPRPIASAPVSSPGFIGGTAEPRPVALEVPVHPFMALPGVAGMHADAYSSDVHPGPGPLGRNPRVITRTGSRMPGGMCATLTFDRSGRLVALCADILGFRLQLMDPATLTMLANYELPARPSTFHALVTLDPDKIMSDTSGGAYYYRDEQDRVVLADSRQRIQRIGHRERAPGHWEFYLADSWDLRDHVPHDCVTPARWFPTGECDPITAVMPDHHGLIWWVTRHARIGTLNPANGEIKRLWLKGEGIENGFSVAADGVSIVTDHALYHFDAAPDGTPRVLWRETYDRGSGRKVGSLCQGSGTTPTLIGGTYVAITDNADERMHVLVYRREPSFTGPRLVCSVPVFARGASTTDNSLIGWSHSILVENNAGYRNALQQKDWDGVAGGIARIDIRNDESGCDIVWTSPERSPSVVPKLSAATGVAYYYTFQAQADGRNAWYLTALDARTGATIFKVLTGVGRNFDNNWGPITLGPDGTAYIGTIGGLVAVRDTP